MNGSIERYVDAADGTRIALHEHGADASEAELRARRAVILTNGLSTTDNFWRDLAPALAADARVVHWDYRGHGGSESARAGDYAIATHADDLARVTESVRATGTSPLPPAHVAFSMGVTVLLELARRRPDLVGAMVLIAGGADHPHATSALFRLPGARRAIRAALGAVSPVVPRSSRIARRVASSRALFPMARAVGAIGRDAPRGEVEHFFRAVGAMDLRAYWETLRSLMEARASDVLPTLRVPVLVVMPERDWLAPRGDLATLARTIPNVEELHLPGTSHAVLLEAGTQIAARVRTFFHAAP